MGPFKAGEILEFTRDLGGVCQVRAGDRLEYLGHSQAVITTGDSKNWLVWLEVTAPVRLAPQPEG